MKRNKDKNGKNKNLDFSQSAKTKSSAENNKLANKQTYRKLYWEELSKNIRTIIFGDTTPKKILRYYIAIIAIGVILFLIPGLSYNPDVPGINPGNFIVALFTASSSFSDTGLSFFDPATTLTVFGQVVMLALIQLGGLGFVSLKIFIWILIRKKVGINERELIRAERGYSKIGGSLELIIIAIIVIIFSEIIGAFCIAIFLVASPNVGVAFPNQTFFTALWQGIFTSVSAVNNAGFEIISGGRFSISIFRYDGGVFVQIVLIILSIIGGIGFPVFYDLYRKVIARRRGHRHKFSLFTKICFYSYFILGFFFFAAITLIELFNPDSQVIGSTAPQSSIFYQLMDIIFTVNSSRSSGLSVTDPSTYSVTSRVLLSISMFIGASPASTGGGIRLTTIVVVVFTIFAYLRGKKNAIIGGKQIHQETIFRSFAVIAAAFLFVLFGAIIFYEYAQIANSAGTDLNFVDFIFIATSAFGTCGLSLSPQSRASFSGISNFSYFVTIYFSFLMFLGQLTVSGFLLILRPIKRENIEYSQEDIVVG